MKGREAPQGTPRGGTVPKTPLRVLVVEDSENDAMLLVQELKRGGYEPEYERVCSPEEMEAALAGARGEGWELVVSDYYMPRFSGPAALALLRGLGYETPFIVVSGKIGEEAAVAMMRAGAQDYVTKDNMARLCPAIERELREAAVRREREETREALEESEDRFRRLVEQAADAMLVFDLEGNFVDVNRRACEALGYARAELLRMSIEDVEVGREEVQKEFGRLWEEVSGGEPRTYEGVHRRRDGTTFPVEVRVGAFELGGRPLMLALARDVTERKEVETRLRRIEEDLRESEERYRVVAETASDVIVMIDEESRILFINGAAENTFGYTREEVLGQELTMLMPDRLRDTHRAALKRYLDTGRRRLNWSSTQLPGLHKSGREIPLEVSFGEFRKEGRHFFTGFMRDITERKRAEEELRHSEERFRVLAEEVVEGLALNENGKLFDANRSFNEMFGYEPGEVIGMGVVEFFAPEKREEVTRRIATGNTDAYESLGLKKDGTVFPIEVRPRHIPYFGREVRVTRVIDLTERRQAEEALRESEERYRAVVEQSAEGIYLVDAESKRILETNPALRQMLGYSGEEMRGMRLYDLIAHSREDVDYNLGRTLQEGRRFVGERRYRRKDGSVADVEAAVSVIRYGDREVVCAVLRDIAERKEAERRLSEMREAERNRIARDLHDDILQDIVYALQEIQIVQITSQSGSDEALEDAADALRRSVEGLRGAIFELRVGTLSRSFFSALEALLDLNRRMSRNRYELALTIEDGFPPEISERAGRQLTRIVQEALTNVRRHAEARRVEVRLWREGETALVEVADDGRGFDVQGPGVGQQSMVQRASEIGGELEVESAPGEGTRVRVRTPVSRLVGAADAAPPAT